MKKTECESGSAVKRQSTFKYCRFLVPNLLFHCLRNSLIFIFI